MDNCLISGRAPVANRPLPVERCGATPLTMRTNDRRYALTVTRSDRRFTAWLFMVFGPLFVAGGFLAAFTVEGALLVFLGVAMLATGGLLFSRLPLSACVFLGLAVFAVQMALTL